MINIQINNQTWRLEETSEGNIKSDVRNVFSLIPNFITLSPAETSGRQRFFWIVQNSLKVTIQVITKLQYVWSAAVIDQRFVSTLVYVLTIERTVSVQNCVLVNTCPSPTPSLLPPSEWRGVCTDTWRGELRHRLLLSSTACCLATWCIIDVWWPVLFFRLPL